jgi:Na+-transporting NADH:ubiquinone oxidoreductase subunit C
MNKNSNSYTIIYITVMVIVVAFVLAFISGVLKEREERNVELDKKIQILASLNIEARASDAEELYDKYIKDIIVVNYKGERVENIDGFAIELEKENRKQEEERNLPIYLAEKDGEIYYVLSLRGNGLWGPLWGYISLKSDKSTIFGAYFSHKGETPGLGAEIDQKNFQIQFQGKEIFKNGEFKSIAVVKPGKSMEGMDFVDGISGGTITSQGVDNMIRNSLSGYKNFLIKNKGE